MNSITKYPQNKLIYIKYKAVWTILFKCIEFSSIFHIVIKIIPTRVYIEKSIDFSYN